MITLEKPIVRNIATEPADWYVTNRLTYLANAKETGNEYALIHGTGGQNGYPPPHIHDREDEVFILLQGRASFRVLDHVIEAAPGSIVYLPRGLAHQHADFSEDVEFLSLVTDGNFLDYYRKQAVPATRLGAPSFSETRLPAMDEMLRIGNEYGITFLPPGASVPNWPVPEIHAVPRHVEPGAGQTLNVLGSLVTVKLDGNHTQNLFSVFEIEDPAGMNGPLHIHHADSEAFYVLEGAYEVTVGDRVERLVPGSFVFVPRGVPRKRRNYTRSKGRMLAITATSGHENFYREIHEMKSFDAARLEVVSRRYGVEILNR